MSLAARRTGAGTERLALALLTVALALLLAYTGWLWRWDQVFYDAQLGLAQRAPPDDVVIVAIDEASLRQLGRWPWSRAVHAELLARLAPESPRAIAFDVIFAEPDTHRAADDARFVTAVKDSGRVVLPVLMEQPRRDGQPIETLPFPALTEAAAGLGHVHVELDPDGIGRAVYLYEGVGSPHWPHLSLALLAAGGETIRVPRDDPARPRTPGSPLVWARSHMRLIPYAGPPGHFRHISYSQVLNGEFSPGTFHDKYVLIGTTAAGLGDALPTPFSGFSHSMSGVEINANILDALRRDRVIMPLGSGWSLLASALLALLPTLVFPGRGPRTNLLMTAVLLILALAASTGLLVLAHLWFAPTAALVAITLSYPLWSWRRLELAMRYLGQELDEMHRQQAALSRPRQLPPETTLDFIARLLPVGGWSLYDDRQRLLEKAGDAPPLPASLTPQDDWQSAGDSLWTRVGSGEQAVVLGVRWRGEQPPQAAEQQLLRGVVTPTEIDRPQTGDSAARDLQSRIHQVQQATTQLRALRQFIDDSLANMADGVIVADFRGHILLANTRAAWYLRGDDNQDLTGLALLAVLEDVILEQNGRWPDLLRRAMLEGLRTQSGARHRDGRDLLVQVAALNTAGSTNGLVVNLSDISLLKAAERQRNELLNFVSHDLRSPLVSLTALLELAKSRKPEAALGELLARMENYTAKTLELAEQFLQLARAESSEGFVFRDVDMVSVALNAMEQVWGQAKGRGISVQQQLEIDEAWLSGDGGLLERALVNLLDNAIKYSAADTTVTLRLSRDGQWLHCCVIDQGPGIAPEDQDRLFDRFHRVRSAAGESTRGAGLGLALVDVVARRHGGQVTVTSRPGQGARFCLIVPCPIE